MSRPCALALIMLWAGLATPLAAQAQFTTCTIKYQAHAWSIFYKNITGTGTINCADGQSARVTLGFHGGGFTFGVSDISGTASVSSVRGPDEILGTYGTMEGHAGFTKSVEGRMMTKGSVWISQAGKGRGFDLGFAFGAYSIRRR
jgi:hypothetical protein